MLTCGRSVCDGEWRREEEEERLVKSQLGGHNERGWAVNGGG